MEFYKFFLYMIVFMVLVIALTVFLTLSIPLRLWFPSLDPEKPWAFIWMWFLIVLACIFVAFLVFLIIMYTIYFFIHSIPLIGPAIADNLPVFSDMKRAGLFDLIGNTLGSLRHGDGFFGKIGGVGRVWFIFMTNSVGFIQSVLTEGRADQQPQVPTGLSSPMPDSALETEDNSLTESEQMQVKNTYEQCLRQNLIVIDPKESNMNRSTKQVQNKGIKTMCAFDRMATYLRLTMANRKLFKD